MSIDKQLIKKALINLEKCYINESEMKYEDFLSGNLLDLEATFDQDDQSHHRQSLEVSDSLDEHAHVHIEHLNKINSLSFAPTNTVEPGAIVSVNGRCMIVAVPKGPFTFQGRQYISISEEAPIYKQLKGKKKGDSFEFKHKNFMIDLVQ